MAPRYGSAPARRGCRTGSRSILAVMWGMAPPFRSGTKERPIRLKREAWAVPSRIEGSTFGARPRGVPPPPGRYFAFLVAERSGPEPPRKAGRPLEAHVAQALPSGRSLGSWVEALSDDVARLHPPKTIPMLFASPESRSR